MVHQECLWVKWTTFFQDGVVAKECKLSYCHHVCAFEGCNVHAGCSSAGCKRAPAKTTLWQLQFGYAIVNVDPLVDCIQDSQVECPCLMCVLCCGNSRVTWLPCCAMSLIDSEGTMKQKTCFQWSAVVLFNTTVLQCLVCALCLVLMCVMCCHLRVMPVCSRCSEPPRAFHSSSIAKKWHNLSYGTSHMYPPPNQHEL